MTDALLRQIEARFHASGSADDEAVWLRARLQAGELDVARLELAALFGHAGAAAALGAPSLPPCVSDVIGAEGGHPKPSRRPGVWDEWDAWTGAYSALSAEAFRRVAVAVATVAYRSYAQGHSFGDAEWVTEELWALELALLDGSSDYELRGEGAHSAACEVRGTRAALPAEAVASAAAAFRTGSRPELLLATVQASLPHEGEIRDLLAAELVPWALGEPDPVRARVQARED
ncbi:MAG: hypothetical protein AB7N76_32060 [Planctomycetota bacterium]